MGSLTILMRLCILKPFVQQFMRDQVCDETGRLRDLRHHLWQYQSRPCEEEASGRTDYDKVKRLLGDIVNLREFLFHGEGDLCV